MFFTRGAVTSHPMMTGKSIKPCHGVMPVQLLFGLLAQPFGLRWNCGWPPCSLPTDRRRTLLRSSKNWWMKQHAKLRNLLSFPWFSHGYGKVTMTFTLGCFCCWCLLILSFLCHDLMMDWFRLKFPTPHHRSSDSSLHRSNRQKPMWLAFLRSYQLLTLLW